MMGRFYILNLILQQMFEQGTVLFMVDFKDGLKSGLDFDEITSGIEVQNTLAKE